MPRYTDSQIAEALKRTKGMVYVAADLLGCSPNTIKARLAKSAALADVLEQARGLTTDTAELKLVQAINAGEPWAVQFYLRTQARERGYRDKTEQEHTGSVRIMVEYGDDDDPSPPAETPRGPAPDRP